MYSSAKGNLHLISFGQVESGWDNLGSYSYVSTTWEAQDCNFDFAATAEEPVAEPPPCSKSTVVTSVRAYKLSPVVVFSQVLLTYIL